MFMALGSPFMLLDAHVIPCPCYLLFWCRVCCWCELPPLMDPSRSLQMPCHVMSCYSVPLRLVPLVFLYYIFLCGFTSCCDMLWFVLYCFAFIYSYILPFIGLNYIMFTCTWKGLEEFKAIVPHWYGYVPNMPILAGRCITDKKKLSHQNTQPRLSHFVHPVLTG
jgi:hypothetical protein